MPPARSRCRADSREMATAAFFLHGEDGRGRVVVREKLSLMAVIVRRGLIAKSDRERAHPLAPDVVNTAAINLCPGSPVAPFLARRPARCDGLGRRPQPLMWIRHSVGRPLVLHRRRLVRPGESGAPAPEDRGQPAIDLPPSMRSIERRPIEPLPFGKAVPSPAPGRRLREPPLMRRRSAKEVLRIRARTDDLTDE